MLISTYSVCKRNDLKVSEHKAQSQINQLIIIIFTNIHIIKQQISQKRVSWGTAIPTIYKCIQRRLGSACASAQLDYSHRYVMCLLCLLFIVKDMRLFHAATEGRLDCTDTQADISEYVNCRICCARAQMI